MTLDFDPDLDLRIDRVIHAPRARVWRAWTDPLDLARWWLPAPTQCRVEHLDVTPGGAFVTSMSDDGVAFGPHLDVCFVVVEPGRADRVHEPRSTAACGRPIPLPCRSPPTSASAIIPQGTDYRVVVETPRRGLSRAHHEALGFVDGWGTVTAQLAAVAEAQEGR